MKVQRNRTHEALLNQGFTRWNGQYAGGQQANNKLLLDYDVVHISNPALFRRIVRDLCNLAQPYNADFIAGVPDGATGYATRVASELGIQAVGLKNRTVHGQKHIQFASELDENMASTLSRGVLLEDVINRRTSTKAVLDMPDFGFKFVAVCAVFDRGIPGEMIDLEVPIHSMASEPIPSIVPHSSSLWSFAS